LNLSDGLTLEEYVLVAHLLVDLAASLCLISEEKILLLYILADGAAILFWIQTQRIRGPPPHNQAAGAQSSRVVL
jgi:hypothetical protein